MKCFTFYNKEKSEEPGTIKSISGRSTSTSMSMDQDPRRSGSELYSQNVSEFSTASSVKSFAALSQRQNNLREFTFSELKAATKNFNRSLMIGEGGFGGVFRGVIRSTSDPHKKIDVAVKQLSRRGLQGHKEWVTEVNVLAIVEHPNLVKLLGYCAEDDERGIQRLLIYEYMPNRSVQDHLSSRFHAPLPWNTRLRIAQDAARGLAYLHEGMEFQVCFVLLGSRYENLLKFSTRTKKKTSIIIAVKLLDPKKRVISNHCHFTKIVLAQIIFRDFKSSNILLDDQWNAKLSDFGLARLGPEDGLSHVSTAVVGTIGYAAPEYVQTGHLTSKSDVWSYGVFIYELITGRRPFDRNRPKNEQKLMEWIKPHLSNVRKFELILDPRLEGSYCLKSAYKLAALANRCLVRQPRTRPKMSEILELVNQIVETADVGSPQLPMKSLGTEDDSMGSKRERLKRIILDPIVGGKGCLNWAAWRPTVVRTC